jgi:hypothetical protein
MIIGKILIDMPRRVMPNTYCFKINSDDMPCARSFNQWLRGKNIKYKYTRQYSQTKLMSWGGWKINYLSANQPIITNFEQNIQYAKGLLSEYQGIN